MARTTNINEIMDSLPPQTLAKIAVFAQNLMGPGQDEFEFVALNTLSTAAFDAGRRNCGTDFDTLYFEQIAAG